MTYLNILVERGTGASHVNLVKELYVLGLNTTLTVCLLAR